MPKRSVYFPDDLDKEMESNPDLPVSSICQDAVREALKGKDENPLAKARRLMRQAERIVADYLKTSK